MSDTRVEREFVVASELGLHARPAGRLATLASGFESEIEVAHRGEWVNARSVLSLLSLAAGPGSRLKVRAEGSDAQEAIDAIAELFVALEEETGRTDEPRF